MSVPGCSPRSEEAQPEAPHFEPGGPLPWRNWGGNQACVPTARLAPTSEDELTAVLGATRGTIRPVGAGHSFSALVPSDGTLIAADLLSGLASTNEQRLEAEVRAGTRLHQLGPLLAGHGLALPNFPDIDYQTLGGAIATSTHGTGAAFGSLSSMVSGLTLATPTGELLECDAERNSEVYGAARCSLGALGVVTRVRLRGQRPVRLRETSRFEPLEPVLEEIERRRDDNRHFEFHAFPHSTMAMTVTTNESSGEPGAPGEPEDPEAVYATRDLYDVVGRVPGIGDFLYDRVLRAVVAGMSSVRVGPSYQVLTHPRLVRFREMEYTVPAEAGPACLREILATIRERSIPVVFPIEYRYVKHDDVWLSQFHDRDGCSISIHQFADQDHRAYFAEIEPIFWKYEGRPHFGKLHSLDAPRLRALYPRFDDFRALRGELDPEQKMLNGHLRALLEA